MAQAQKAEFASLTRVSALYLTDHCLSRCDRLGRALTMKKILSRPVSHRQ
jgi:hypothetical protein